MPIIAKSKVHTTGKSQAGGERGGCLSSANCFILLFVRNADSPPTAKGTARHIIKSFHSIFDFKMLTPQYFLILYVNFKILCS